MTRKLFACALVFAIPLVANEMSYRSLQSGSQFGGTPLYDRGIHGEGQVIAILDTGLDYDNCFFAEANRAMPPVNLGTPGGGLQWQNVDPTRRKVIAYNFLYSCAQYPNAPGCDDPNVPTAWDNQGHGTHAASAAAADSHTPLTHNYADAIAPGAKLVIQDAGFIGGDNCSQRPGIGCPANLTPILDQAYRQGARIHSNSWGDRQGVPFPATPPTANYPQSARDIDAFVYSHPDMLVVFNTGNFGSNGLPPASTLSAPGSAKNTLQVGGTRVMQRDDTVLSNFTLVGPTRDGRIKPDLVGPAYVLGGDSDNNNVSRNCDLSWQGGTSWSAPTVAGAAALVRQYYADGFYPTGVATQSNRITPSAALLKATLIASARAVRTRYTTSGDVAAQPVPSYEQGFGFPTLDDALFFPGDRAQLRVVDLANDAGLAAGQTNTIQVNVRAGTPLRAVLVWTDPPGTARVGNDPTPQLVNDLDLRVNSTWGNEELHPGQRDTRNNVEAVTMAAPAAGTYTITVNANRLGFGAKQGYALVLTGDFDTTPPQRASRSRAVRH